MEQLRTARRSASHGSLNRSYAVAASPLPRVPSAHPTFARPLRSVNENAALLPSPGPLESMLKTTTETGDIGLFSIKPVTSSTVSEGTLRPRPGLLGQRAFLRPHRTEGSSDGFIPRDDRRRLPSYRDTTSEIISMYGSDSQPSISSSVSLAFEDTGQRSYSMTSCSSRALPNQRSNGTLQSFRSQSSGHPLQRPRSPFPYPTRLKRPGVRPSSPALTESGSIDYSRMVEIDRVSSRTIHGSYKPTYPAPVRRPPPWFTHSEGPRPSHSNAKRFGTSATFHGPPLGPAHAMGSSRGSTDSPRKGQSEQTNRTMSLGSFVDMYQRAPGPRTGQKSVPARPGGTYYFDYSEGFETDAEEISVPVAPLAPIPTRAANMYRPVILDQGCEAVDYDEPTLTSLTNAPPPGCSSGSSNAVVGPELVERNWGSEGIAPDALSPPSVIAPLRPTVLRDIHIRQTSAEKTYHPRLQPHTCNSEAMSWPSRESVCDDDGESQESTEDRDLTSTSSAGLSGAGSHGRHGSESKRGSTAPDHDSPSRQDNFYSLDTGLADMDSLVQHLDEAARSPQPCNADGGRKETLISQPENTDSTIDVEDGTRTSIEPQRPDMSIGATRMSRDIETTSDSEESGDYQGPLDYYCTHARAADAPVPIIHQAEPQALFDRSKTPMLAPQPISPARELKVKNSIPQLMKALPPLPDTASDRGGSCIGDADTSCDEKTARRRRRYNISQVSSQKLPRSSESMVVVGEQHGPPSAGTTHEEMRASRTAKPRLRLRNTMTSPDLDSSTRSKHKMVTERGPSPELGSTGGSEHKSEQKVAHSGYGKHRLAARRPGVPQSSDESGSSALVVRRRRPSSLSSRDYQDTAAAKADKSSAPMVEEQGLGDDLTDASDDRVSDQIRSPPSRPAVIEPREPEAGTIVRKRDEKTSIGALLPAEANLFRLGERGRLEMAKMATRKRPSILAAYSDEHQAPRLLGEGLPKAADELKSYEHVAVATAVVSVFSSEGTSGQSDVGKGAAVQPGADGSQVRKGMRHRLSKWMRSAKQAMRVACHRNKV